MRSSVSSGAVHVAMCVCALACALLALTAGPLAAAQRVTIGVLESRPEAAQELGAAVASGAGRGWEAAVAGAEPAEPLALARHVCALAAGGAAAAVAGGDARDARLAAEAAARAGLPLLLVEPAPAAPHWEVLTLHPHRDALAAAAADVCRAKGWRRAVLLHDAGAEGAPLLAPDGEPMRLLARHLPPPSDAPLLRDVLLVLKKLGETNFIVWCEARCAARVLEAAQRVGMVAERHSYVILALDLHTQRLGNYSYGGANITGLRLFNPKAAAPAASMRAWRDAYRARVGEAADDEHIKRTMSAPRSALLLARRGARLAVEALTHLALPPPQYAADCAAGRAAFHADTLLNYLRSEEWVGADAGGPISWEGDGGRHAVQLEVVEMARGGRLAHAGVWSPRAGLTWQRDEAPAPAPPPDSMTNRTFNILIAPSQPYIMRQESMDRLSGNERYEGFCIELIEHLADILKFNYTFIEHRGVYGNKDPKTGKWNGMLGRLMADKDIDFAITDLTITAEREQAVDFTTPFMNLGISILFRKPEPPEPELFAFLLPFSNGVWLCLGIAYVGSSLILYVVGRLCHEEWQNPYPCIEEPDALENQFTLGNALWFNLGAVLLQGSEIAPVAYGTRAVAGAWWVFALVITSSYTANLATLLATKTTNELITNVEDLAHSPLNIDYGAKQGGSTFTFFQQSQNKLYQEMYEHMRQRQMPNSNEEGIDKVTKEMYAFLMESTTIEYVVERNCKVTKVGGLLDSKGYGIAMKKNSEYRQALNLALLNLQESGVLRDMKNTWWNEKHGGGACRDTDERGSVELAMRNFLGLFLVLIVGCALGVVISCMDLAVAAGKRARLSGERFSSRFAAELRFVFRFEQSVKPILGPLSASSSESERVESESVEGEGGAERETSGGRGAEREASGEGGAEREASGGGAEGRGERASRRRRSSIHAASLRLARHTAAARDSRTPSQQPNR